MEEAEAGNGFKNTNLQGITGATGDTGNGRLWTLDRYCLTGCNLQSSLCSLYVSTEQ